MICDLICRVKFEMMPAKLVFGIGILCLVTYSQQYFDPPSEYDKICNVMDYGAKGDGKTNDTLSILSAIKDCYSGKDDQTSAQILFPSFHTFLSSALYINYEIENVGFKVESNTTLLATNNISLWPSTKENGAFITIENIQNIVFDGGGIINGNGMIWWKNASQFRPHLMNADHVNGLIIRNLTFINCPNHCLELGADKTEIYNISIINPPSNNNSLNVSINSHNTDGIDVHGSPFYVRDSIISTGLFPYNFMNFSVTIIM